MCEYIAQKDPHGCAAACIASGVSHAIVIKKDGTIFDPLNKNIESFDAYKEVSQVIGIYRHA